MLGHRGRELEAWSPSHTEAWDANACCWGTLERVAPRTQGADVSPPGGRTEVLRDSNRPERMSPADSGCQVPTNGFRRI